MNVERVGLLQKVVTVTISCYLHATGGIMSETELPSELTPEQQRRRTLIKGAAWSVPVLALAVAAPAAAASLVDIGPYTLIGSCGILGIQGPGFILTASASAPIPVGTSFVIVGSGVANIGVFSATPNAYTSVTVLSSTSRQITVISEIPAAISVALRTTLSITVPFTLNAVATLPSGYVATGAKSAASVTSTYVMCSAT